MTTQATLQLNFKRIAIYFKRTGITVHVERLDTGEFLITDRLTMVRVSMAHPDLAPYLAPYTDFDPTWKHATFELGKGPAIEAEAPDQLMFWDHLEQQQYHPLTLTNELCEVPGSRKGGTLWRRFTFEDTQLVERRSYFNKAILDMFSPDLDELKEFRFEQIGHTGAMRIISGDTTLAFIMPGTNIEKK